MLPTRRLSSLGINLPALLLGGTLLTAMPLALADSYDPASPETPAQAEHTAHRQHLLLLFPAGVAVLTLGLIIYTRRK